MRVVTDGWITKAELLERARGCRLRPAHRPAAEPARPSRSPPTAPPAPPGRRAWLPNPLPRRRRRPTRRRATATTGGPALRPAPLLGMVGRPVGRTPRPTQHAHQMGRRRCPRLRDRGARPRRPPRRGRCPLQNAQPGRIGSPGGCDTESERPDTADAAYLLLLLAAGGEPAWNSVRLSDIDLQAEPEPTSEELLTKAFGLDKLAEPLLPGSPIAGPLVPDPPTVEELATTLQESGLTSPGNWLRAVRSASIPELGQARPRRPQHRGRTARSWPMALSRLHRRPGRPVGARPLPDCRIGAIGNRSRTGGPHGWPGGAAPPQPPLHQAHHEPGDAVSDAATDIRQALALRHRPVEPATARPRHQG